MAGWPVRDVGFARCAPSPSASDPSALRVPHPGGHRCLYHLDVRAKPSTRALHSARVVVPIALPADRRNEASVSPDPHVTADFRRAWAPFERAPSTPSTGRFLRVCDPRTARSLSVRAAVYVPRFDGVVNPDDSTKHMTVGGRSCYST